MKLTSILIFSLVFIFISCNNKSNNKKQTQIINIPSEIKPSSTFDHIKHIRANSRKETLDGEMFKPEYFVDYAIENLLEKPEYKKYITNRNLLRKLNNEICWDNYVLINDTLSNGDLCRIEIKTQSFSAESHKITKNKFSSFLDKIDGKYPFGAVYSKHPDIELKSLEIKINGTLLDTQIDSYRNIYEPQFCIFGGYQRKTEAFEDGENIYIYIFGGNAADSYFAKLVFDKTGFVTSIIAEYSSLSNYGSFGDHFIGY